MGGLTPVSPAQLAPSAIKTTFLGEFAESEIRNLVKRSFNLDKEEAYLIDFIVASPKTDYQASSEFVRHACFLLLQTYYRDGILEQDYEGGTLSHLAGMRRQASRSRLRSELKDDMHKFDDEVESARAAGDTGYLLSHLRMWQTLIATAPTPSVSQTIKQVVAGSSAIRRAVEALQKWGVQGVMEMSEEDGKLVTEWVEWLED